MNKSRQKALMIDLLESAPSLAFLLVLRSDSGLELAGWIGSASALLVFVALYFLRSKSHPILLGVNIHLLLITPIIVGLYKFGGDQLASILAEHAHKGVLLTVVFVGALQTLFMKTGFVGSDIWPGNKVIQFSGYMLAVGLLGSLWALATDVGPILGALLPIAAMIGLRNYLLARWQDQNGPPAALCVGIPSANQHSEIGV